MLGNPEPISNVNILFRIEIKPGNAGHAAYLAVFG
jgi:hypothetical protein